MGISIGNIHWEYHYQKMVTSIEVKIVKIVNMGVPNGNPYNISIKLWSHTLATQGRET